MDHFFSIRSIFHNSHQLIKINLLGSPQQGPVAEWSLAPTDPILRASSKRRAYNCGIYCIQYHPRLYNFFLAGTNSRDCRFQFKNWVVWPNDYRVDCQAIISSSQCIIHVVALVNVCCHPQPLDARPSRTHCHPSSSSHFHINHNHQRTTSTTPYNKLHADAACHSKCKLKLAAGALAISGSKQRDADLQRQSLSLSLMRRQRRRRIMFARLLIILQCKMKCRSLTRLSTGAECTV